MTPRVILLEFNELTPALMERFIAEGRLRHFQRLQSEALICVTEAKERPPELEPWIQWVTVHTGLDYDRHGIFHLNEGHRLDAPRVWDVTSAAGLRNWVCGSMNVGYRPGFRGALIPDPWCTSVRPVPDALGAYFRFVQSHVLEYSNNRVPVTRKDQAAFLAFLALHGVTLATASSAFRQILSERSGANRWKRAALLDRFQFDVFRWYWKRLRADFATFFVNSTAHFQHSYWRHMDPDVFPARPDAHDIEEHGEAIAFGYEQMDQLIGRFLRLAGRSTTIVLATALSQQPCVKYDATGGARFHRPREIGSLLRFAGVTGTYHAAPVMTHQFHLDFPDETSAADAERRLAELRCGGKPVLDIERTCARLFTGCAIYVAVEKDARIVAEGDRSTGFFDHFYLLETTKSGMHHPDGILWIRPPGGRPSSRSIADPLRVPLSAVAPTLLSLLGLAQPPSMRGQPIVEALTACPAGA